MVDVNLTVSQVSRVAVIGANGAGMSTAFKVLVGEQLPTSGSIWKAAGLRLAYVARQAFYRRNSSEGSRMAGSSAIRSVVLRTSSLHVFKPREALQTFCPRSRALADPGGSREPSNLFASPVLVSELCGRTILTAASHTMHTSEGGRVLMLQHAEHSMKKKS